MKQILFVFLNKNFKYTFKYNFLEKLTAACRLGCLLALLRIKNEVAVLFEHTAPRWSPVCHPPLPGKHQALAKFIRHPDAVSPSATSLLHKSRRLLPFVSFFYSSTGKRG